MKRATLGYTLGYTLGFWAFLSIPFTSAGFAAETFTVTPSKVVSFGTDGDAFGLDSISPESVLVLVRPRGEDCTLRFPLRVGERLFLRTFDERGHSMVCDALLVAIVDGTSAQFSAHCLNQTTSTDRKCPPS